MVIRRNPIGQENPLDKAIPLREAEMLSRQAVVGEFDHNMALVLGVVVIGVDDAHGVIQLDPEAESVAGAGEEPQPPARLNLHPYPRGDDNGLPGGEDEGEGRVKIIASRPRRGPLGQGEPLIGVEQLVSLEGHVAELGPQLNLGEADFFKFRDAIQYRAPPDRVCEKKYHTV